jgi:hypothetical protein
MTPRRNHLTLVKPVVLPTRDDAFELLACIVAAPAGEDISMTIEDSGAWLIKVRPMKVAA